MTNKIEFEYYRKRAGLSRKDVADYLGFSEATLGDRILNKSIFRSNEIAKLIVLLKINTMEELKRIFFDEVVEN